MCLNHTKSTKGVLKMTKKMFIPEKNGIYFLPPQENPLGAIPVDGLVLVLTPPEVIEISGRTFIVPIKKGSDSNFPNVRLEDETIMEGHQVAWWFLSSVEVEKLEEFKGKLSQEIADEVRKSIRTILGLGQGVE